MAAAPTAVPKLVPESSPPIAFDFSQPPVIEGFTPLSRPKDETFKEKFIRKTKDNPFVPIGELHKLSLMTVTQVKTVMAHQSKPTGHAHLLS